MRLSNGQRLPLAPQGLAELTPIIPEAYYYPDFLGMQLEYQYALYGEIYRAQPWVFAVINKRADAVARLPVDVWDVGQGTRTLDTRSQYARLISAPCPYMDNYRFWHWVQSTIDIYGETFLAIVKDDNGIPIQLLPMHPSRVAIKRNPSTGRYTYYFQAGSGVATELVRFEEDEVVPFRRFNPNKLERGFSRMEAIKNTIFAEDSSRNAVSAMWRNAGRPNIVLESEKALGPEGRKRLRDAFNAAHAGSSNAGKTLVLEDGVSAKSIQLTAVELELIENRQMNRQEICGVYDVAETMVHIEDHSTFSNISSQMRAFYRDTMAPVIEFIQSVMDKYVGSFWVRQNVMRFATDEVIRGDYEVRAETVFKMRQAGICTANEGREIMGFDRSDQPHADDLMANSALQVLGMPAEQIRLQGQVEGSTPDGVQVQPATTPVGAIDGGPPHALPPAPGRQRNPGNSNQSTNGTTTPPPKHLRAIKGEAGRGRTDEELMAFAYSLYQKYPDDLDDIRRAVEMAIAQRVRKANN